MLLNNLIEELCDRWKRILETRSCPLVILVWITNSRKKKLGPTHFPRYACEREIPCRRWKITEREREKEAPGSNQAMPLKRCPRIDEPTRVWPSPQVPPVVSSSPRVLFIPNRMMDRTMDPDDRLSQDPTEQSSPPVSAYPGITIDRIAGGRRIRPVEETKI